MYIYYIIYKGWHHQQVQFIDGVGKSCNPMRCTATSAACKVTPIAGRTGMSENSGCAGRISWATKADKHR